MAKPKNINDLFTVSADTVNTIAPSTQEPTRETPPLNRGFTPKVNLDRRIYSCHICGKGMLHGRFTLAHHIHECWRGRKLTPSMRRKFEGYTSRRASVLQIMEGRLVDCPDTDSCPVCPAKVPSAGDNSLGRVTHILTYHTREELRALPQHLQLEFRTMYALTRPEFERVYNSL